MTTLDFSCSKTLSKYTIPVNEGCMAKIFGQSRDTNPYEEGTPHHQAWAHGWDRA